MMLITTIIWIYNILPQRDEYKECTVKRELGLQKDKRLALLKSWMKDKCNSIGRTTWNFKRNPRYHNRSLF